MMGDKGRQSTQPGNERPGAVAVFPYDRMTVEHFREKFPRARWSDERKAWFVPGNTARRRIDRWLAREAEQFDVHADLKGRDAYEFEPIISPYLEVANDLRVRTPYSRSVLAELRAIPWAHWDDNLRLWRVPFRSYEELRRRWSSIEAAAQRNEPEERRLRAEARKNTPEQQAALRRSQERRRRRYPLPIDDLPPIDRPVNTERYGIVVFTEMHGELIEGTGFRELYPHVSEEFDYIWGVWRVASLSELIKTWPARRDPTTMEPMRGWWQPTLTELREARRKARSLERRSTSNQRPN